jgi:hypothetical protein
MKTTKLFAAILGVACYALSLAAFSSEVVNQTSKSAQRSSGGQVVHHPRPHPQHVHAPKKKKEPQAAQAGADPSGKGATVVNQAPQK